MRNPEIATEDRPTSILWLAAPASPYRNLPRLDTTDRAEPHLAHTAGAVIAPDNRGTF